ncbi:MAG TPA: hypothetical protein VN947_28310 [Polyangia bacterium]|nr:hypothetical protein [Polyangia bacterium]
MICPMCATVVAPSIWKLVGAFVTAPLAIGGVVAALVWRAHRRAS